MAKYVSKITLDWGAQSLEPNCYYNVGQNFHHQKIACYMISGWCSMSIWEAPDLGYIMTVGLGEVLFCHLAFKIITFLVR